MYSEELNATLSTWRCMELNTWFFSCGPTVVSSLNSLAKDLIIILWRKLIEIVLLLFSRLIIIIIVILLVESLLLFWLLITWARPLIRLVLLIRVLLIITLSSISSVIVISTSSKNISRCLELIVIFWHFLLLLSIATLSLIHVMLSEVLFVVSRLIILTWWVKSSSNHKITFASWRSMNFHRSFLIMKLLVLHWWHNLSFRMIFVINRFCWCTCIA